jgi:transcriptional regulator with XRE-family HTH domain
METIGQRVRAARERHGMTQAELSRRIHASINAINMLEIGSISDPKSSRVLAIAEVLGVTTDYLLGRTEGTSAASATPTGPFLPTRRGRPRKAAPLASASR